MPNPFGVPVKLIREEYWERIPPDLKDLLLREAEKPGSTGLIDLDALYDWTPEEIEREFRGTVSTEYFVYQTLLCPECKNPLCFMPSEDEAVVPCPECGCRTFRFNPFPFAVS